MRTVFGVVLILLMYQNSTFAKPAVLLSSVAPMESRPDLRRWASTLDDLILAELSGSKALRLVDRASLEAIMQERKLSLLDLADAGKAIQIGKLVGANRVVSMHLGTWGGDRLGVGFVAADPGSGEIVGAHSISFAGTPSAAARKLALEIESSLSVRPRGTGKDRRAVIAMLRPENLTVGGGYEFAGMALHTQLVRQLLSSGKVILVARESVGDLIAENLLSRFERGTALEGVPQARLSLWSLKSTYDVQATAQGGFAPELRVGMELTGSLVGGRPVEWEETSPAGNLVELAGHLAIRILKELNIASLGPVPGEARQAPEGAPDVRVAEEAYAHRIREAHRIFREGLERCGDDLFNGKGEGGLIPASVIREGIQMHLRAMYVDPFNLAARAAAIHCLSRLADPGSAAQARKLQNQFQSYAHVRIGHEFQVGRSFGWIPSVAIDASRVKGVVPRKLEAAWASKIDYAMNLRTGEAGTVLVQTRAGLEVYDAKGERSGWFQVPQGETIKFLASGNEAIYVVLFESIVSQSSDGPSQSEFDAYLRRETGVRMVRLKPDGKQDWSNPLKETVSRWAGLEPEKREIFERQFKGKSDVAVYPCALAVWPGEGVLTGSAAALTLYSDAGQVRWRIEARESGGACGPMAFAGPNFGVVATSGTNLLAFDGQGKVLWRRQLQYGPRAELIQLTAGSDVVFVGTQDGALFSIDRSGQWKLLLKTNGCFCTGLGVLKGGTVVAASSSGIVHAVGADGKLRWSVPLGSPPESIAVAPSGELFAVGAGDNNIYIGNDRGELIELFARKDTDGITSPTGPGYVFADVRFLVVGGFSAKTITGAPVAVP